MQMIDRVKELERIRVKHGGTLAPKNVVDESRPEEAALHDQFDWVDESAAEKYRLQQARMIIRTARIVKTNTPDSPTIRAYVNLEATEETAQSYHKTTKVVRDPELRAQMVEQAWRELSVFKARFREIISLAEDPDLLQIGELITSHELKESA